MTTNLSDAPYAYNYVNQSSSHFFCVVMHYTAYAINNDMSHTIKELCTKLLNCEICVQQECSLYILQYPDIDWHRRHHRLPQILAVAVIDIHQAPTTRYSFHSQKISEDNTHLDSDSQALPELPMIKKWEVVSDAWRKRRSFARGTSTSKLPKYGVYLYPLRPNFSLANLSVPCRYVICVTK